MSQHDDWLRSQTLTLLDEQFLATLSEQKDREIHARIAALDINENPVDQIEGRVTGGNINIDGSSAVRRTCSLTMVCDQVDINDFYWGIKTKFKLEIGLCNHLTNQYAPEDGEYPEIVWFPEGIFVVTSFNTSISTNNCTISISGKDKMCLLNGDLGGQLFASIDFGTEETLVKTMEVVANITNNSSDGILANEYYYKPTSGQPETILSSDETYAFIINQAEGNYYKDGNLYRAQTGNTRPSERKYYTLYKKAVYPSEIFERVYFDGEDDASGQTTVTYEKNLYFYEKYADKQYYVVNTRNSTEGKHHYKLTTLYTMGYEKQIEHLTIEKIIRSAVHEYAKEPYHNIIINDLDDYGLEQLTYRGDKKLYALRKGATEHFVQLMLEGANPHVDAYVNSASFLPDTLTQEITSIKGTPLYLYDNQLYTEADVVAAGGIATTDNMYYLAVLEYGDDIGYRLTDLTYPGDLISSIGETLTSILDKIKTMLGDFEYFYDTDGRFVFQRQRTYVNTSWSQLTNSGDETYVEYGNSNKQKFSFNFEGNRLISAIQNSPVLNNLRNDFTVWGKRKGISGADIPIHARYAIDKKPVFYKTLSGSVYTVDKEYAIQQLDIPRESTIDNNAFLEQLAAFDLQYPAPEELHLTLPTKRTNGTWTPGWWDIRDWAAYYKLLTNTTADPDGTMKFYSSGDANGCIPIATLQQNGTPVPSYYQNSTGHVWLIEVFNNGSLNFGHGSGTFNPNENTWTTCTYYTSYYDNTGRLRTVGTDIKKNFSAPYRGCADQHTYLYFLDRIVRGSDRAVYFYNPDFPLGESAENLINDRIEEAYNTWKRENDVHIVDWREIIYQMASDYMAGQGCSVSNPIYLYHFEIENPDAPEEQQRRRKVLDDEPMTDPDHFLYEVGQRNPYFYPTGYTGYEQYYTDILGFWRQLYNPNYLPQEIYSQGVYKDDIKQRPGAVFYTKTKVWNPAKLIDYKIEFYFDKTNPDIQIQFAQLKAEMQAASGGIVLDDNFTEEDLANIPEGQKSDRFKELEEIYAKYTKFMVDPADSSEENAEKLRRLYWSREVSESPEQLNFWLEFLDSDTELASFSVQSVSARSKVVNEDKASAIFFTEIPGLILCDKLDSEGNCDYDNQRKALTANSGYVFIYLPKGFSKYFTISYRATSVKDKIDALLYQYAYCIENISITAIPVYHLQPNTRIYVQDKTTEIEGEYIVSRITLPLTYNGAMSITAAKAPERLY